MKVLGRRTQGGRRRWCYLPAVGLLVTLSALWSPNIAGSDVPAWDGTAAGAASTGETFVYPSADAIPANTWVKLSTPEMQRFIPQNFTDCGATGLLPEPSGRSHSAISYGNGSIFYFGGGDKGYPANDVELYDVGGNTWVQQYPPECIPTCCTSPISCNPPPAPAPNCGETDHCACNVENGVGTAELTPLGRPYTEHVFQLIRWNPVRQRFLAALTGHTWEYDPATKVWATVGPQAPWSQDIATKGVAYDPNIGMLYFATAPPAGPPAVYRFDYPSGTWVLHGTMPSLVATAYAEVYSAYDADDAVQLVSWHGDSGHFWLYDAASGTEPAAGTWTEITNSPAETHCTGDIPDACVASFDYDIHNHLFLVARKQLANFVQLWTYSPARGEWRTVTPAGAPPVSIYAGFWGTLVYDAPSDRFYFLNVRNAGDTGSGGSSEGAVETWTYQLLQPQPGDANCDERVTAADLTVAQEATTSGVGACGVRTGSAGSSVTTTPVSLVIAGIFAAAGSGSLCMNPTDVHATFRIANGADDAFVRWQGGAYPPPAGPGTELNITGLGVGAFRTFSGPGDHQYFVYNALLQWDMSSLPGDATVTQAWLQIDVSDTADTDGLQLTAGWYDWSGNGGADLGDWTGAPETNALGGINIGALTVGQVNTLPLSNVATGTSITGITGMRLHISQRSGDAPPTGQNYVTWAAQESGDPSKLVVCYSVPLPKSGGT